jgi:hypothetical protein
MLLVQPLALLLVASALVACSDSRTPAESDASPDATSAPCNLDCSSGELCFATGPSDAAPPASCQFVPTACMSNPSCQCLGPTLCPGAGGYQCSYDEIAGYVVLECSN